MFNKGKVKKEEDLPMGVRIPLHTQKMSEPTECDSTPLLK